jgi:cation diffusion facilitator family transporter
VNDKTKAGYIEGSVSIVINTLLFALKLWAGVVTGSIAVVADAWHTLSDTLSSIIVVLAVKLSSKEADKEHPFGHGRWEQIASLIIAAFLGVLAFEFMKGSIEAFQGRDAADFGALAILVTILSIVTKELLAQYAFFLYRKTGNASIKADGWHHRTDALSSAVVLAGILLARQFWWIDSVLGAAISLMLFYATYEIMRETITKLLGEEPSPELILQITEAIRAVYHDDLQLHHFHIHNYVMHQELTLHIMLDKNLSIEKGHEVATGVEALIEDKFGMTATIHIEPLE